MKDGQIIQDKKSVVNGFNDFFVNIGKNLTKNITKYHRKNFQMYLNNSILCAFSFKLIDHDYTEKLINSLRTKKNLRVTMAYPWNSCNFYPLVLLGRWL